MGKGFARWTSDGQCVKNLQLTFWMLATEHFDILRDKWRQHAQADSSVEPDEEPVYDIDQFIEDAAVALVLAGTSVTILLGQNTSAKQNGSMPSPRECIQNLLGQIKPSWKNLIDRYDALRHFGEPKQELINDIDETIIRQDFEAAQEIWCGVLTKKGQTIDERFKKDFSFN